MIGVKHREINTFCPSVTTTTVRWNFNGLSDGLRIFPSHRRAKFVLLQVKVFTRDNHLHLTRRYAAKSDRHIWSPHKQFANCRVRFPFSNSRYLAGRREPSLTVELAKESWKWNILCFRPGGEKKKNCFDLKQRMEISGNNHSWKARGSVRQVISNSALHGLICVVKHN